MCMHATSRRMLAACACGCNVLYVRTVPYRTVHADAHLSIITKIMWVVVLGLVKACCLWEREKEILEIGASPNRTIHWHHDQPSSLFLAYPLLVPPPLAPSSRPHFVFPLLPLSFSHFCFAWAMGRTKLPLPLFYTC